MYPFSMTTHFIANSNAYVCPPKEMFKNVCNTLHNLPKLEATQMLIDSRKNKNNLDIFIQC